MDCQAGVLYILLLKFSLASCGILYLHIPNQPEIAYGTENADFGPSAPLDPGLRGYIYFVNPVDGCDEVEEAPPPINTTRWIAFVAKLNCSFIDKVLNIQRAGYAAAVVYNWGSNEYIYMYGDGKRDKEVKIPSAFIGQAAAQHIMKFNSSDEVTVRLVGISPFSFIFFIIPFICTLGLCVVALSIFVVVRIGIEYYRKRKARLPPKKLNKIPTKKFVKGSEVDVCAVCLDEYEEGVRLRVLPCGHEYHQKCIDPWLTQNRRTCPLCKRKVFASDDSDSDAEANRRGAGAAAGRATTTTERTPLLRAAGPAGARPPQANRGQMRRTAGYGSGGRVRRGADASSNGSGDSDDDNNSVGSMTRHQESRVEVHPCPRHLLNIDSSHSINNHPLPTQDLPSAHPTAATASEEALEGAVGGVPNVVVMTEPKRKKRGGKNNRKSRERDVGIDNAALDLFEDHFSAQAENTALNGALANRRGDPSSQTNHRHESNVQANRRDDAASHGNHRTDPIVGEYSDEMGNEDGASGSTRPRSERKRNKEKYKKKGNEHESNPPGVVRNLHEGRQRDDDDDDDDDNGNDIAGNNLYSASSRNVALV